MPKTRKQHKHSQKGGFWDSLNNWWANTSQKTKEVASNAGQTITKWSDDVANKASELSNKAGEALNKDVSISATTNNTQSPTVYQPTQTQPMAIGGKKKSQKRRRLHKKSKSHGKKRTSKK